MILKLYFKQIKFVDQNLSDEQLISLKNLLDENLIDSTIISKSIQNEILNFKSKCSICNKEIEKINFLSTECNGGHKYDIDTNSLLILNPIQHSSNIIKCFKCYQSTVYIRDDKTSLWPPDPNMLPIRFASKCCPFCI